MPLDDRDLMIDDPIRFEVGTCDADLWDAPDRLIEKNQALSTRRRFLGSRQYVLDLGTQPTIVNIMKYEDTASIEPLRDDQGAELTLKM